MTKKNTLLTLVLLALVTFGASALNIPKGTFYFDNSLTKYSVVKFVFGSYSNPESYVMTMTSEGDNLWSITIPETVTGMYRYCFAETSIPDGQLNETFPDLKDRITSRNEMRTSTCELSIPVGWVFTPTSGDNWAMGSWQKPGEATSYSGTLPVMFINTENSQPITSKEEYIFAYYYIDNMGNEEFENVGSEDAPQPLEIRGRGNYTWSDFDKKPYRLKLDAKTSLLGMKRNKHWALMANADDYLGGLRNTVGYELSRRLGLAWTPAQQPVEVVLNGDYIGLYMLTETIRVEPDRVNVTQQADYETSPFVVSGGWLVEIDNYQEEEQVRTVEGNGQNIFSTYKSPEHLSDEQRTYLTGQVDKYCMNDEGTEFEYVSDGWMFYAFPFSGYFVAYYDLGEESNIELDMPAPLPTAIATTIGDVNKDGSINVADITALTNILVNGDEANVFDHVAADINQVDGLTRADVSALVDLILEKAPQRATPKRITARKGPRVQKMQMKQGLMKSLPTINKKIVEKLNRTQTLQPVTLLK